MSKYFNSSNVLTIAILLLLTSCGVPLKRSEMLPQFDFYDTLDKGKFEDSIFIRNVEVAKNVGGVSPVTPKEFRATIVSAFRQADLYSRQEDATYFLDAYMSEMDQPAFGFTTTVTTTSDYKVYEGNGDVVFQETVKVPCSKTLSDAFDGARRWRMASGCAVGENITHIIKVLSNE